MQMDRREAARILGRETRVQLRELLVSYATPESDTTGEESGGSDGEEGGCAHSSAFITRSRSKQQLTSQWRFCECGKAAWLLWLLRSALTLCPSFSGTARQSALGAPTAQEARPSTEAPGTTPLRVPTDLCGE